jgi:AraC family transcriptional activator of pobA
MFPRKENLKIPAFGLVNPSRKNYAIKNLNDEKANPGEHNIKLPHRDDHYMLVLIQQGRLKVIIDFETYEIKGPSFLMVFPDQVHHITPLDKLSGWAVSFEGDLIPTELRDALDKDWRNCAPVYVGVSPDWRKQVDILLLSIFQLNDRPLVTTQPIVSSLLTAVLYIILGHVVPDESKDSIKIKRPATIKNQFITLLYQHYKFWKKPSLYADKLNISTAHLNDTVKKITGRSATDAIQEHCILEARRLLTHTDLRVKEIAYEIGFENFSHFIKIFKNITGLTPVQYRQSRK